MQIFVNVFVANTHDVPALRPQIGIPSLIMGKLFVRCMRGAVDLHDEPGGNADKIGNIRSDRMLTSDQAAQNCVTADA